MGGGKAMPILSLPWIWKARVVSIFYILHRLTLKFTSSENSSKAK